MNDPWAVASQTVHLHPGEVLVQQKSGRIQTLLGSCVAVCFWDPKKRIGGMNHITLPICRQENPPSARYGNIATFALLDLMKDAGCMPRTLSVRMFGGAMSPFWKGTNPGLSVGPRNILVTEQVLQKLNFTISGQDVGGERGRKLVFDVHTGKIHMNYLREFDFSTEAETVLKGQKR